MQIGSVSQKKVDTDYSSKVLLLLSLAVLNKIVCSLIKRIN